ncbi:serine hydrolase domain-containing protein [Polaromonas sp. YR568]|uniref:serine hydrolase domain-containing protein n=1 Tax=Polaromonas sp. YR568 TaxID=1855301 RepID=UPI003137798A
MEKIRAIVEAESTRAGTQAVQFGMWVDRQEVLTMALGNSMTTVPATTNMHYRIGGITWTFQSTLLLMLAEQGRIRLDDAIARWYPNLLSADKVTIRMLVANTAGYLDYVNDKTFLQDVLANPFRRFTPDELIAYSVQGGLMGYPPGTSQRYSHTECVLLGRVIEKAMGQSLKSLYETHILGPVGLQDTQFPLDQEIQAPVLHSYIEDRGVYEDATYHDPSWAGGGALTSSLHDLGKWGHVFGSGQLLTAASFREMISSSVGKGQNRADLYFAYGFVYANGWLVQNPDINGYSGGFAYNLATGVTIVVAATKRRRPAIDPAAIHILREVIKYVTPATPLNF